jgi:hypothetical protein
MKKGLRKINSDIDVKSIQGNKVSFASKQIIDVSVPNKKIGLCAISGNDNIFKCKTIKGISSVKD